MSDKTDSTSFLPLHPDLLKPDELKPYEEEFRLALSDPEITNIALSGPYGAGKSTVVRSWERSLKDNRPDDTSDFSPWVYVSLSEFDGERKSGADGAVSRDVESELLNQLIFKLKHVAPKTRFSVMDVDSPGEDGARTVFILALIILAVLLISGWQNNSLPWSANVWIFALVNLLFILAFAFLLYQVVRSRAFSNLFKRLKFFDAEIEVFSKENDPAFNRYMDEVVYLLASSDSDVIVFEDIDRFSDISLFEKLRRVNELVNARKLNCVSDKKRKDYCEYKPIRFIYLFHDGFFENPKDRTKFFDLIIPVIPFVDPANSVDILQRGLKGVNLSVSDTFLYQLSLYIDDPRILKDICNESRHFKTALCKEGDFDCWEDDKLVAMMAYKVLFQSDYERLRVREGFVFSLFSSKSIIAAKFADNALDRIKRLRDELSELDNRSELESRQIKLLYSLSNHSVRQMLSNNNLFSYTEFDSLDSFLDTVEKDSRIQSEIDKTIEKMETADRSLSSRLNSISGGRERQREKISQKIAKIEREISYFSGRTLSQMLSSSKDVDKLFEQCVSDGPDGSRKQTVLDSKYYPMLRFLLIQGFIDETYQLYMSNRYNDTMSDGDKQFLFALLGSYDFDPGYVIGCPGAVLMRISPEMLSRSCARNFSLFSALLEYERGEKLKAFLDGVVRDDDYIFVLGYVLSPHFSGQSLKVLSEEYSSCVKRAISDDAISLEARRTFCHRVMSCIELSSLSGDSVTAIRDFANSDTLFLIAKDVRDGDVFIRNLKSLKYYADAIDFKRADRRFLEAVARDGMYFPDQSNILGFVNAFSGLESIGLSQLNNVLFESDDSLFCAVADHVLRHIDFYLVSFSSSLDGFLEDRDTTVALIMNEGKFGSDLPDDPSKSINRYVKLLPLGAISNLSLVDSVEHKALLLSENRCVNSTSNICSYLKEFDEFQFDQALSSFLKSNGVPEDLNADILRANEVEPVEFLRACLESPVLEGRTSDEDSFSGIDDATLRSVANRLNCGFNSFEFDDDVDSKRVETIIDAGCLAVSKSNILFLRNVCSDCVALLASKGLESYLDVILSNDESIENGPYVDDEVIGLFEIEGSSKSDMRKISDDAIGHLVRSLTKPISLSTSYSNRVNLALLEDDKDHDFSECFCELYLRDDLTLRKALIAELSEYDMSQLTPLLEGFSDNRRIALDFLSDFLSSYGDRIQREGAAALAKASGLDDFAALIGRDKQRISLKNDESEKRFVRLLQEHEWCGVDLPPGKNGKIQVYAGGSK